MYAAKLRIIMMLKKNIEDFEDNIIKMDNVQEFIRKTNDKLHIIDYLEKEKQIAEYRRKTSS